MPVLTGSEGTYISKSTAKTLGDNYVESDRFEMTNSFKGHYFGKNKLSAILGQTSCVGLRIYYATKIDENSVQTPDLVIVGVNEDGDDILNHDLFLDVSVPCPPLCADPSKSLME